MASIDIAIVGAACRLPQAASLAGLGEVLFQGRDAVTEIPEGRWNKAFYLDRDPRQPGRTYTFAAGVLDDIQGFDPGFFGMSPREAIHTDPQQRLLLELAYEAMEDAGFTPGALSERRIGVFCGGSSWDYTSVRFDDVALMDSHSMQGGSLSSHSNRLSYIFNLRGPSLTVDTACSSALVALHLACESISRGETPAALVGAANLLVAPQSFVGFSRASMLSPLGRCHAFDSRADGYVRAEGGGVVILKPLRDALADGDEIRAVIRGTGVNSDGRTNGFSLPSRDAQAALLREVYSRAELEPDGLSYLEAHGTGTPVGDPIEAGAIGAALGRRRTTPLPIGSVKTNVGHLEAASAMAGLMKVLLAFERGRIPASLHFETPNPHIPFDELNLEVVSAARDLPAGRTGAMIGINSFGFGGTNAHAILAAPPVVATRAEAKGAPVPPLVLSAHSSEALRALAGDWRDRLAEPDPAHGARIRGAARRRQAHPHRLIARGADPAALGGALDAWLSGAAAPVETGQAVEGDLAFVFSGNGSQWIGMGREAFAESATFRDQVEAIDTHFEPLAGWRIAETLRDGVSPEALRNTEIAQPLLFAVQAGVVAALRAQGVVADAHIGHSAGEIAAAWAAGALTLPQACAVAFHRSHHQQATHGQGGMAALGLGAEAAAEALAAVSPSLEIVAVNSAGSLTVAGPVEALDDLQAHAKAQGWFYSRLDLEYAFHSAAMEPIRDGLLRSLEGLKSSPPKGRLVSTVTGEPVAGAALDARYWWRNVREPVLFSAGIERLVADGARLFLEIGPQPVLQSYIRDALRRADQGGAVLGSLAQRPAGEDPFPAIAGRCHVAGRSLVGSAAFDGPATARGLPAYPWRREPHWIGVSVENRAIVSPEQDHPLLGFRREDGQSWSNHLSTGRQPWLADHAVGGEPVTPAAGIIDMALAVARLRHPDAPCLEIADLEISRPLTLDATGRETRFSVSANGSFDLTCRRRLADEAMETVATGRIVAGASAEPLAVLDPLGGDIRNYGPEAFYELTAARNLDYGPNFQIVANAVASFAGVVEIDLVRPETDRLAEGYLVDPALLDGALQGLVALVDVLPNTDHIRCMLPWRIGRVRLLDPAGARPVRVRLQKRKRGPRAIGVDIVLTDASGRAVVELLDCWFVELRATGADPAALAYHTALVPTLRQPDRAETTDPLAPALAAVPRRDALADSVLLAEAFAAAAAHAALAPHAGADGLLADEALTRDDLLAWLADEGLAEADPAGWRLKPSDLPPAGALWRSLLFDTPAASAELVLAGHAAQALSRRLDPDAGARPAADLVEQMLFASPSGQAAAEAVAKAAGAVAAGWPRGRALRLALIGSFDARSLRRVLDGLAGIPLRCVVATSDGAPAGLAEAIEDRPGVSLAPWEPAADPLGETLGGAAFDLVLGLYAFSGPAAPIPPAAAAALLAPGGAILVVEPEPNRVWPLALGAGARFAAADSWAAALRETGCEADSPALLPGAVWPAAVIGARRPFTVPAHAPASDSTSEIVLVLAADDPFADEVVSVLESASHLARRLPLDALSEVLDAPSPMGLRDVVILAPRGGEAEALDRLVDMGARMAAAAPTLAMVERTRLWLAILGEAGPESAALSALRRVIVNEFLGMDCRFVHLDRAMEAGEAARRLADELDRPDAEMELVHTPQARLVPRLRKGLPPAPAVTGTARRLDIRRPGLLGSLAWTPMATPAPGPGQVAIEVRAVGLNFRDVMWALGLLPDEALLNGFSGPGLGLECAGVVTALGEGVEGLAPGDSVLAVAPAALASHVVTARHAVMPLPASIGFAEAATLPVAFMTAVYALSHLGRVRPGERVLIHGGAGGVGLAAIQVARHHGAEVFATAGSPVKREMLKLLGVEHVFDSRSSAFADDVLKATGGEGVDVVLNSLSGELMEQSLRLLRPFGRFLEIGKRDLFRNTAVGIRPLRHNGAYFAIDVDQLALDRPELTAELFAEIANLLGQGTLRPLPYRRFGFDQAADAFRLMQGSGHVGKIVLTPEPAVAPAAAGPTPFHVRDDRTYLVTGGLGGFGLETARWLVQHGARNLALVSRSGPQAPDAAALLDAFADQGVAARAYACDVGDPAALAATLAEVRRDQPPIAGVIHSAMVLDDAFLANLDAVRVARVVTPKAGGAENLDRLTREDPIELFVLYGSISRVVGSPGQANYAMANAALEAIAERRHSEGLPALAVQWGAIGDVGHLARDIRVSESLAAMGGSSHLKAADALAALPLLLASGLPVAGYASVDWGVLQRKLPLGASSLFADMPQGGRLSSGEGSLRQRLAAMSEEEAREAVQELVVEEISRILRLERSRIDIDRPIANMGFDSLMAVELRLAIEEKLHEDLPMMSVGDGATLRTIAGRLLRILVAEDGRDELMDRISRHHPVDQAILDELES